MVEITVVYHDEDGLWWADSDDVAGWTAGGSTLDEVRMRVAEGLPFFLGERAVDLDERLPTRLVGFDVSGLSPDDVHATASATCAVSRDADRPWSVGFGRPLRLPEPDHQPTTSDRLTGAVSAAG